MATNTLYQEMVTLKYRRTQEKMASGLQSRGLQPLSVTDIEEQQRVAMCLCDPSCPICGGTGYIRKGSDLHPTDKGFGGIEPCPNYRSKTIRAMDVSQYGLESDELDLDWKVIKNKIGYLRLDGTKAVEAVKPKFEQGHGMIALLGSFGQGKTLVGKILIAKALLAGKRAVYANMSHILDDIRTAFDQKEHMTQELVRRMEYWNALDVLFVDELDKVNGTEWAAERMFQLLDRRYARAIRYEALTVIASNKKDDELDGYLVSRLKDHRLGPVVYLNGDDARAVMPEGWRY